MSQSGGRSGAVQRFAESHAICARRLSAPVRTRLIALLSPPSLLPFLLFTYFAASVPRPLPSNARVPTWRLLTFGLDGTK